jgi:hypothetical protein
MAAFVRPAAWNYDLPLFRTATDDPDELESLLAAIALEREGLWVVESDEQPVAFAHTERLGTTLAVLWLFVTPGHGPGELIRLLLGRISKEAAGKAARITIAAERLHPTDAVDMEALGFRREGPLWSQPVDGQGE